MATEFELQARRLRLRPEMYVHSEELRLVRNRNTFYVPEWLLKAWDIRVDANVTDTA